MLISEPYCLCLFDIFVVDYLWKAKSSAFIKELKLERELQLQEVKRTLLNSTFEFSSAYRL